MVSIRSGVGGWGSWIVRMWEVSRGRTLLKDWWKWVCSVQVHGKDRIHVGSIVVTVPFESRSQIVGLAKT